MVRRRRSWRARGVLAARSMRRAVGGMKALRTPLPRHQRERLVRIELVEASRHHRYAVMQRRQQRVEQSAGPGPVGRRPEQVARLRKEIVRHLDAGHMAEQHAMRVQARPWAGRWCRTCRSSSPDRRRRCLPARRHRTPCAAASRTERIIGLAVDRYHQRQIRTAPSPMPASFARPCPLVISAFAPEFCSR